MGGRLGSELAAALRELSPPIGGGSSLSRALGVDRATCQRVVLASRQQQGLEVLRALPGPDGLEMVLRALAPSLSHGRRSTAQAALDEYRLLILDLGGSQSRMLAFLRDASDHSSDDPLLASRRALFDAAGSVVGRRSELTTIISAYMPAANGTEMRRLVAGAHFGHRADRHAMPLTMGSGRMGTAPAQGGAAVSLDGQPLEGSSPLALLREFCSEPAPSILTQHPSSEINHIVEWEGDIDRERAVDVAVGRFGARNLPLPSPDDPRHAVWALVSFPTRRLVLDVFLHRALATSCIANASAQGTGLHELRAGEWTERLPSQPTLQHLGTTLADAPHRRVTELERHVFGRAGWDITQFVGYRLDVVFPIWRAAYCVWFDFSFGND